MDEIKIEIAELRHQLTGDMEHDMDMRNEIHRLQMILWGVEREDSSFDCEGCGS